MAAETITVYIDPVQLKLQKNNNYSLYLAKMVNGQFTVIWQSKGPIATPTNPGTYSPKSIFVIAVPNYEVNYGTTVTVDGSVTFSGSGIPQTIDIGQTVDLSALGLFDQTQNTGTAGTVTINNLMEGNPLASLLDSSGNPIFFNSQSGMDIGTTTFTPIDTYQLWFENHQDTGTIIATNTSNVGTVTFSGGTTDMVISYNEAGSWVNGPLPQSVDLKGAGDSLSVAVMATFKYALTAGAVTYLLNKLINKFSAGLRPSRIEASVGGMTLKVTFSEPQIRQILATFGADKFEAAVNLALKTAQKDASSGLSKETWTLSESLIAVSC